MLEKSVKTEVCHKRGAEAIFITGAAAQFLWIF